MSECDWEQRATPCLLPLGLLERSPPTADRRWGLGEETTACLHPLELLGPLGCEVGHHRYPYLHPLHLLHLLHLLQE